MAQRKQDKLAKKREKRQGVRKFPNKKKKQNSSPTAQKKKLLLAATTKKTATTPKKLIISRDIESTTLSTTKKRVSFASKLVDSTSPTNLTEKLSSSLTDTNLDDSSSSLKPILKRRLKKVGSATKTKRIRAENEEKTEKSEKKKKILKAGKENKEAETTTTTENGEAKTKKIIRVTRLDKEKLLAMPRKEKREYLRLLRAERKPYFDLAMKAKILWEKIRSKQKRKTDERQKLIDELYALVEGKVAQLIFAHDTVRVIQCLMALKGNTALRTKLFNEVKDHVLLMSKSKYARFFVIKMLKYGTPAQRDYVMQRFYGKIPKLLKHSVASEVVEYAYNEYANALQRSRIISEFYSPEFALWKVDEAVTLEKILQKQPERKPAILQSIKEHITDLSTKPVLRHSLIHRLIREFLDRCTEADRQEVIDLLKERVVEMVHTKDGAVVSMRCVWYATSKERKIIVRTFKNLVAKTCCEEYGHLVLLAIFDSVDDTILVQRSILKEIEKNLDEIVKNKHGIKVLHYLLNPRDKHHFLKETVALFEEGDQNPFSKKEMSARHEELLASISPIMLAYVSKHMKDLILDAHTSMLVLSILENAVGDKTDAYRALCVDVLADEFVPMNIDHLHAVEHAQSHYVLTMLIRNDKTLFEEGKKTISETLVDELSPEHFLSWMSCNKGAFILVRMYETGIASVKEKIADVVKSSGAKKKLKQYTFPAAKILAKKVS